MPHNGITRTKPLKGTIMINLTKYPLSVATLQSIRFDVVDTRTGLVVGSAKTRARANQSAIDHIHKDS